MNKAAFEYYAHGTESKATAAAWREHLASRGSLLFFVWSSSSLPVLYDVLRGPALCWKKVRSQQKMWCLHMFLYSSSFCSCRWRVTVCAAEEKGRLFVGACCVLFVVVIPPHSTRGLCVHSSHPPKNRDSLWQHSRRRACDTPERIHSERVTPSPNLLSLRLLCAPSVALAVQSESHF